jgi:hypothetical protein
MRSLPIVVIIAIVAALGLLDVVIVDSILTAVGVALVALSRTMGCRKLLHSIRPRETIFMVGWELDKKYYSLFLNAITNT